MSHPDRVLAALESIAASDPDLLHGPRAFRPAVMFEWSGTPVPKGRPRMGNGHVYTPSRTREFEEAIGWAWRETGAAPFEGDVVVTVDIYEPSRAADLDNYVKACLDGLNGLAFADDRQVTSLAASVYRKHKPGGVRITIESAA